MDNNNKLKLVVQENPKKYSDKRMILQNETNINKRKSDVINFINSTTKSRNVQNNKLNKIPINIRSSYQENQLYSKINLRNIENNINNDNKNNKDKDKDKGTPTPTPDKKDKNYYLNLLSDIYLNDSHYSNKNIVKNFKENSINNSNNNSINSKSNNKNINDRKEMNAIDVNKNFLKKKTCNLSNVRGSKFSFGKNYKSSKKIGNNITIENRNKSKKLSINASHASKDMLERKSSRKLSNFSKEMNSNQQERKILIEKVISKFKNPERSTKAKLKEIYKKFKSSQNINIINEKKNDETLKEEKNENNETMQKEIKSIKININNNENNNRNSKRSRNVARENEKGNLQRCYTQINSNKNIPNNKKIKVKKVKKMYKTCFFCCLIKNDDSVSDND